MTHTFGHRIAEVARLTGLPATTLRYYEEIGLIPAPGRSDAGYRTYDARAVERLLFIARGRNLGCSLDEVGELVAAWECDTPGPDAPRLRAAVERKIAKLDAKIAEMTSFRRDLLVARQTLGEDAGDADREIDAGDVSD